MIRNGHVERDRASAPETARRMAAAAREFLASLSPAQLGAATLPFAGDERFRWEYRPAVCPPRKGLRLVNMTREQQALAFALLEAGLSVRAAGQSRQIMALETILREVERQQRRVNANIRDPELYFFAVFGEPGESAPWAWRVGGHHLAVHFTVVGGDLVAAVPCFLGANPAEVRHGPSAGLRTLLEEAELARALLSALEPAQRAVAVVSADAPPDILTGNCRVADLLAPPRGLAYAAMSGEQRERLVRLVRHYLGRASDEVAANAWRQVERAGLEAVTFAWAGPEERGRGHYYAVKGPTLLLEYDNTQNGANHIHSVWRDFTNDWGLDLLAAHYAESHRRG